MAIVKLTINQIADIFKRIVGRDPTHNDYPAIVGLSNMDGMTVQKIEEFFAPLKTFVIPAPVAPVKVTPAPAPVPVPAPVKATPAPAPVKLAPHVEPKPVTAVPHVDVQPIPHPKPPVSVPVKTAWDNDDKTPVDMPKKVDKHVENATIHGKKKGKNK